MTGRPLEVEAILGIKGVDLEELVLAQPDDVQKIQVMERLFAPSVPIYDDNITLVNQIIDYIADNREISKVEQIVFTFDMNIRRLQRLFSKYVGVNPKSVIRLFRPQNAKRGDGPWTDAGFSLVVCRAGVS